MGAERPLYPDGPNDYWLAVHLRKAYGDVVNEPLPESFQGLLQRLRETDRDENGAETS
ncbi:NepR family anti-sigma factor [Roseospira marina]|nr:NepR family anti-sigma factor [Roseospira marina]